MAFTDTFIKRPVLSTVISLFIFIFGLSAIYSMQVRQYPKMDNTVITITTSYPGASADLVQGFITTPIEKSVSSADGVDYFTSNSDNGVSTVTIYVRLNYDPSKAFTSVMSKVEQVKNQLPAAAQNPVIVKKTGSTTSLMYISFNSKTMSSQQITSYLSSVVQPKISTVSGVASAEILGGFDYAMRVWLDPVKMSAYGITPADVSSALQKNNFQSAAGQIKGKYVLMTVNAKTSNTTVNSFKNLVIKTSANGGFIRLQDVAKVELGSQYYDSSVYFNNKKAVFLAIDALPTANPLTVIAGVRKVLPNLELGYPSSLNSKVVYDATQFINASIKEVLRTIVEASLIVILVIFLFMGSLRTVLIPVVTMPLSLVGVFGIMLLLGYSINLLTLLALVLAIGLVVDDAIVVVENTYRHIEEGATPLQAALEGAREIVMPIVAMTLTLAAVYLPIGFIQGVTGALFTEFAFTLAAAVIVSGVIALTLSPMMCSKMLTSASAHGRFVTKVDAVFGKLKSGYHSTLLTVLNMRKTICVCAVIILISCGYLYQQAPKELAPTEDQGLVFTLTTAPKYANIDYVEKYSHLLGKYYDTFPSKFASFTVNGMSTVNSGISMIILKPWSQRKQSQAEVYQKLNKLEKTNPGLQLFPVQPPALPTGGGGLPIQFVLTTLGSYHHLYEVMQSFVDKAMMSGRFLFLSGALKFNKPIVDLTIDRDKAAYLGASMQDVGNNLAFALGGNFVNRFSMFTRSFEVIPQLDRLYRTNANQINSLYLKALNGQMYPLSNIANVSYSVAPNSLTRFNQLNSTTIQGMMLPSSSLGSALSYLETLAKTALPRDVSYSYAGTSREYMNEGNTLAFAFLFSLIVIFLVLAAQFESFSMPLVVMTSVPMAICGALIPINWGGKVPLATMNIYTQIGLITLIGLISKHGILMVDFADKLRLKEGLSRFDAILKASAIRLRPVLMTTAAMIFGVLPLLFASGAGAVSRFDIGLTITSGMFIGTLFTLFVVPVMYTLKPSRILTIIASAIVLFLVSNMLI